MIATFDTLLFDSNPHDPSLWHLDFHTTVFSQLLIAKFAALMQNIFERDSFI